MKHPLYCKNRKVFPLIMDTLAMIFDVERTLGMGFDLASAAITLFRLICCDVEIAPQSWSAFILSCVTLGLYEPEPTFVYSLNYNRTTLALLMVIATAYVIYSLLVGAMLKLDLWRKKIWKKAKKMVLIHKWFAKTKVISQIMTFESVIPGNPLYANGLVPKSQIRVCIPKEDGTLVGIGAGIRLDEYLITPAHNCTTPEIVLLSETGVEVTISTEKPLYLCADVFAFKLTNVQWSKLGAAMVRLAPLSDKRTVTIVSSVDKSYSIANLTRSETFGRCIYNGSTHPGFSGSVYHSGQQAYGMHCHGGTTNGGYQLLYLWAKLKLELMEIPETSSTDYAAGKQWEYEEHGHQSGRQEDSKYIMEEKNTGRYHVIGDHGTKEKIMQHAKVYDTGLDWNEEVEREEERRTAEGLGLQFAGEYQAPEARGPSSATYLKAPQASKSGVAPSRRRLTGRRPSMSKSDYHLKQQQWHTRQLQKLQEKPSPVSSPPVQTPPQSG
nr:hypothetical protein [Leuven Luteo-like virus 1]